MHWNRGFVYILLENALEMPGIPTFTSEIDQMKNNNHLCFLQKGSQ